MPDPVTNAVPQTADLWGNSSDPNSAVKQPYGTIGDMQVDHINPATSNVRKVSAPDGSTVIFPKGTTVAQANDQMSSWWDGHTQRAGSLWNGIKNYVSNASQALGGPADLPELQADEQDFLLHPDETIKGAIGGLLRGMNSAVMAIVPGSEENKAVVARAQQEWHDGNHIAAAETLIPLIGDGLAKASKQAQSGDYSGSFGTATGTILPFLVGGEGALGDTAAQVKGYYLPKSTLTEALPVEDTGLQPKDTGLRPADASLKVPDAGLTPEDAGLRPTETRLSPVPVKAIPTPLAVAVAGGTYATPAPTYHEAAAGTSNPWVRSSVNADSNLSPTNVGRQLLVQISSNLINTVSGEAAEAAGYYDKLYSGAREGFTRLADFWEIPTWIANAAHMLPNADVYVVRDVPQAIKFLNEAKYDHVMFSALDTNKSFIKDIANGYDGKIIAGGYVEPGSFLDNPNVEWHPSLESMARAVGEEPRIGADYRHFQGSDTIPRLTLSDGCLHKCAFCVLADTKVTVKPTDVINQQADAIAQLGAKLTYISDKTFGQASNYEQLADLNASIKAKNPNFQGFIVQTTAAQLGKLPEEFLAKSGIKYVELGIESYNDPLLKEMHKPATERLIDNATQKLRKLGITLIPNVLIGYPGETIETYQHTLDFLKRNDDIISHANIYNLALYDNTELGKKMTTAAPGDFNENVLEKSWHDGQGDVHQVFAGKLYGIAQEQLGKTITPEASIAEKHNRYTGFTYNPEKGFVRDQPVFSVAGDYPELEQVVPGRKISPEQVKTYIERPDVKAALTADPKASIGGYTYKGNSLLEVSRLFDDKDEAIAHAKATNQESIYDHANRKAIPTGGTAADEALQRAGLAEGNPITPLGAAARTVPAPDVAGIPEDINRQMLGKETAGVTKTPAATAKFLDTMGKIPEVQEYTDIALQGEGARKWYQRSSAAFDAMVKNAPEYFSEEGDKDKFLGMLAGSSPRQSVAMNMRETLRTWKSWVDAGRPELSLDRWKAYEAAGRPAGDKWATEKLLADNLTPAGTKVPNIIKAMNGEDLWPDLTKNKNFKVPSFERNLKGWLNHVTNDGWMALFAGLDPNKISDPTLYHPMSVATRAAAEALGWEPAEAQAAIWSFTQALTERGEEDPSVIRQYSEDFADIMAHDPATRELLEDLGVQLDKLDEHLKAVGEKPEITGRTTGTTSRSVGKLKERIETARGKGTIPPPKSAQGAFDFREGHPVRTATDTAFNPNEFEGEDETKPELKTKGGTNPTRSVGAASINDLETKPDVPAFYSKAEQVIGEKVPNNASGEQISALLKNNGVKADEMKWAGLDDFLKDKPKVSKAELQQFIKENQISLGEEDYGKTKRFTTRLNEEETADIYHPIVDVIDPNNGLVRFTGDEQAAQDYMSELGQGLSADEEKELNKLKATNAEIDAANHAQSVLQIAGLRNARQEYGVDSPEAKAAEARIDNSVEIRGDEHSENRSRISALEQKQAQGADRPTKYDKWTVPGERENYQEKLLTLPTKESPELQGLRKEYTAAEAARNAYSQTGSGVVPGDVELRFQDAQNAMRKMKNEESTSRDYVAPHFGGAGGDQPTNIVAHVRFDDRPAVDGKKTLFMEEAQSDWHSAGRHEGYKADPKAIAEAESNLKEAKARKTEFVQSVVDRINNERQSRGYLSPEEGNELRDLQAKQRSFENVSNPEEQGHLDYETRRARIAELAPKAEFNREGLLKIDPNNEQMSWKIKQSMTPEESAKFDTLNTAVNKAAVAKTELTQGAVPDAPFKQSWHELVMKRMLREAAEKGYDRLAWTTGKQQADLYDLTKHIGRVEYDPEAEELRAYDPQGKKVVEESISNDKDLEKELTPYIGADLAEKLAGRVEDYQPPPPPEPDWFYDSEAQGYDVDKREVPDENQEFETVPERDTYTDHVEALAKKYGLDSHITTAKLRLDLQSKATAQELAEVERLRKEALDAEKEQEANRDAVTQYFVTTPGGYDLGPFDSEHEAQQEMRDRIDQDVQYEMENYEPDEPDLPQISGLDLKHGGEFHKLLYDTMIPSFLKKYAKKWGANVGTTEIKGMGEPTVEYQGPELSKEELHNLATGKQTKTGVYPRTVVENRARDILNEMQRGIPFKDAVAGATAAGDKGIDDLVEYAGGKIVKSPNNQKVHSIEITPEMRKSVMKEGQPIAKNTMPHEAEFGPKFKQSLADKMTEALA